jgi:hypothetical protein
MLWNPTLRAYSPRLRGRMSEHEPVGRETPVWYAMSDERAWFEQIGRAAFSRALRKAQEQVARGDITLGPDPTPVSVEVGEETFLFGMRQGNPDAAEEAARAEICCSCRWEGKVLVCIGPCCIEVIEG